MRRVRAGLIGGGGKTAAVIGAADKVVTAGSKAAINIEPAAVTTSVTSYDRILHRARGRAIAIQSSAMTNTGQPVIRGNAALASATASNSVTVSCARSYCHRAQVKNCAARAVTAGTTDGCVAARAALSVVIRKCAVV